MTLSTILEHMHVIGYLGKHIMVIATNVPPFYMQLSLASKGETETEIQQLLMISTY